MAAVFRRIDTWTGLKICQLRVGDLPLKDVVPIPDVPPGTELRKLTLEDVRQRSSDPDLALRINSFQFALEHGHVPLGLFINDQLVHYTIYGHTVAPGPRTFVVRANPNLVYVWGTFTPREFRGQHLVQLRTHLSKVFWSQLMGDDVYDGFVSYIDVHNLSSIATNERYGDRLVGYAGYLAFGSRAIFFRTKGAKQVGFRFDQPSESERVMLGI